MKEICLSAKGLKQAALLDEQSKFTFVVGKEEREFQCARFQACFVSKKVCNILSSDPTVEKLRVLADRECSCFGLIESLWNGESVCVDKSNSDDLIILSRELENDELSKTVQFHISAGEISIENCVSRLHLKQSMGLDGSDEIEFIASKFHECDASFVRSLSVSELEQVLQHGSLKLENENSLFDIILNLSESDEEYSSLLKYVRFEFMDSDHVAAFMDAIYPARIDFGIWESLTRFVVCNLKENKFVRGERYIQRGELFEYDSSSPLKGIFCHLREKCGGNPHSKGLIEVTASSNEYKQCYNVLDYGWNSHWRTNDVANSWIQFDMKDSRVCLASYTIKTFDGGPGDCHLRKWKIEASNDCSNWVPLDVEDTDALNGYYFTKNFECSQRTNEFFRYIRLTQTGKNWCNNDNYLLFKEIEFFGRLLSSE